MQQPTDYLIAHALPYRTLQLLAQTSHYHHPAPTKSAAASDEISALQLIVQQQQSTINSLQRQLDFVLSFLGIVDPNLNTQQPTSIVGNNNDLQSLTTGGSVQPLFWQVLSPSQI
jgi:hypothetical protein